MAIKKYSEIINSLASRIKISNADEYFTSTNVEGALGELMYAIRNFDLSPTTEVPAETNAYYNLDSATEITDGSGNEYNGTPYNLTQVEGKIKTAIQLNGTDSYVELPFNPGQVSGDWSVSFWINTTASTSNVILSQADENYSTDTLVRGWAIDVAAGKARFYWRETNGGSGNQMLSTVDVNTGELVNITLVKVGTTATFYINDVEDTSETIPATLNTDIESPVYIGRMWQGSDAYQDYFTGIIDELRFYNRALDPADVTLINEETITNNFNATSIDILNLEEYFTSTTVEGALGELYNRLLELTSTKAYSPLYTNFDEGEFALDWDSTYDLIEGDPGTAYVTKLETGYEQGVLKLTSGAGSTADTDANYYLTGEYSLKMRVSPNVRVAAADSTLNQSTFQAGMMGWERIGLEYYHGADNSEKVVVYYTTGDTTPVGSVDLAVQEWYYLWFQRDINNDITLKYSLDGDTWETLFTYNDTNDSNPWFTTFEYETLKVDWLVDYMHYDDENTSYTFWQGEAPAPIIEVTINPAEVTIDTTNFDGILSSADDDIQKALDTIDNLSLSADNISLIDSGDNFTAENVEGALGELLTAVGAASGLATIVGPLTFATLVTDAQYPEGASMYETTDGITEGWPYTNSTVYTVKIDDIAYQWIINSTDGSGFRYRYFGSLTPDPSDDFEDASINTTLWTTTLNGGTAYESGGVITANHQAEIATNWYFADNNDFEINVGFGGFTNSGGQIILADSATLNNGAYIEYPRDKTSYPTIARIYYINSGASAIYTDIDLGVSNWGANAGDYANIVYDWAANTFTFKLYVDDVETGSLTTGTLYWTTNWYVGIQAYGFSDFKMSYFDVVSGVTAGLTGIDAWGAILDLSSAAETATWSNITGDITSQSDLQSSLIALQTSIDNITNTFDASDIDIVDAADNFVATTVEGALAELFTSVSEGTVLAADTILGTDNDTVYPLGPSVAKVDDVTWPDAGIGIIATDKASSGWMRQRFHGGVGAGSLYERAYSPALIDPNDDFSDVSIDGSKWIANTWGTVTIENNEGKFSNINSGVSGEYGQIFGNWVYSGAFEYTFKFPTTNSSAAGTIHLLRPLEAAENMNSNSTSGTQWRYPLGYQPTSIKLVPNGDGEFDSLYASTGGSSSSSISWPGPTTGEFGQDVWIKVERTGAGLVTVSYSTTGLDGSWSTWHSWTPGSSERTDTTFCVDTSQVTRLLYIDDYVTASGDYTALQETDSVWSSWFTVGEGGSSVASDITITDTSGYYTATNVEDAFAEVYEAIATPVTVDDTPVDGSTADAISSNWAYDHINDASVHTADNIDIVDSADNFVATTVEGALAELFTSVSDGMVLPADTVTAGSGEATFPLGYSVAKVNDSGWPDSGIGLISTDKASSGWMKQVYLDSAGTLISTRLYGPGDPVSSDDFSSGYNTDSFTDTNGGVGSVSGGQLTITTAAGNTNGCVQTKWAISGDFDVRIQNISLNTTGTNGEVILTDIANYGTATSVSAANTIGIRGDELTAPAYIESIHTGNNIDFEAKWVRITRVGTTGQVYYSTNGTDWTAWGSSNTMGTYDVILQISAYTAADGGSTVWDNLTVTGDTIYQHTGGSSSWKDWVVVDGNASAAWGNISGTLADQTDLQNALDAKLAITDIDDIPVDAETAAPISSNWAYDHINDASVHTADNIDVVDSADNFIATTVEGALAEIADYTAEDISVVDSADNFTSTTVEDALAELFTSVSGIQTPTAADITITDTDGYYTAVNVEDALAEIYEALPTVIVVDDTPVDGNTTHAASSNWAYDHLNDASVHTAANIDVADANEYFTATNVEAVLAELYEAINNYTQETWSTHTTTAANEGITGAVNTNYLVDTTASTANITLTMPSTSTVGDSVQVTDLAGTFAIDGSKNVITDSVLIHGSTQTYEFDMQDATVKLVWTGATYGWKVIE